MITLGTWKGKTVYKGTLDEYCDTISQEDKLNPNYCFLLGDILHYQGWKIGEVHGNTVSEWKHPIETEYSENFSTRRDMAKKPVEVPQEMSNRADYPEVTTVTIGEVDYKDYSKVVDEFFKNLDDNFDKMLANITIDLEGWK